MATFELPPPDGPVDPRWLTPLVDTIESIDNVHRCYRLSPGDFSCLFKAARRERPDVYGYVHRLTGRALHLDADTNSYRFVESRHPAQGPGRFLRYRKLSSAFDHLALWELPWSHLEVAVRHKNFDADYLEAGYLDGVNLDGLGLDLDNGFGDSFHSDGKEANHGRLYMV